MIDDREAWNAESAALKAEMAERERKIKYAETLEWCKARQASTTRGRSETVTRDYLPPRRAAATEATMITADWQNYIRQQLDQRQQIMMKAIAQIVVEEEREREKLAAELEPLRERVATLEAELGEMRAAEKLRTTLDSLDERLGRIEASRSGLKAIPGKSDSLIA